ncbi:hypothetical protein AN958_09093, partial [Leucoagaricus sp. SymC.cos]
VTIHLQVHVMEQAPYRLLLGRPFDVITESRIANSMEGHQFISITDPNTGEHASLSTYPRGRMLNNPDKMPNATINCWVDYIRTSFQFTLIHNKGKTFGSDGLSRRKWYPGDPIERRFDDGSEDDGEDLEVIKENTDDKDPLPLETFIDEIDT